MHVHLVCGRSRVRSSHPAIFFRLFSDDDKDCESFEEQAETIESQDCLETSYTGEDDSDDDATVGSENKEKAEDNIGKVYHKKP